MNRIETLHFAHGIGASQRVAMPEGSSIADIARVMHGCADALTAWISAPAGHINEWIEVPRSMWACIKPKANCEVTFGYRLGKSALKSVLSLVAAVLVAIIAPYLSPLLGALFATAVGIGASLAINALFPPEQQQGLGQAQDAAKLFANVESDSNVIAKEAHLAVVNNRRVSLPEIAAPFSFLENGIQTIQRIFALDGHHLISNIRVDGTPVEDFDTITTEIADGAEATGVSTFINKVTKSAGIQESLSTFQTDGLVLVDQETPSNSEPRWVRFSTANDANLEEISIRVRLQGFTKSDDPEVDIRVPIRIRFRPLGSEADWDNIPEIHLLGNDVSTGLKEIRFRWDGIFDDSETGGEITYGFFGRVPEATYTLSTGDDGDQWQAHSSFSDGVSISNTTNIQGRRNGILITLDEGAFPKGEFEFEIKRGCAMEKDDLSSTTYAYDGVIHSFFNGRSVSSDWQIPVDQGSFLSNLSVAQVTSIIDRQPCQRPKTALLAIKSKGQTITNITARADKYVLDWDGSGWNNLTTTKNPAPHFRQVLFDYLTYHGINTALISDASIVAWRAECEAQGYEASTVFAGSSMQVTLDILATAGYARRIYSDGFGVDYFRDRSTDRPVQSFSPRNARISLDWLSGERPAGIRAKFQNEDADWKDDEIQVVNPFYTNTGAYAVSSYSSISKPILAERRAYFELLQAHYQSRRSWTVETAIEGMICERGDLVAVVSDLVTDDSSGARIREVLSPNTFRIDQVIPAEGTESIFDVDNLFDAADIFKIGAQSVVMFSTPTGSEIFSIIGVAGDVIRIDGNLSSIDVLGSHIAIGPTSNFTRRCIVMDVERQNEERATLKLVDEAPEIYAAIQEKFG